jgi:hypothetical protein
MSNIKILVTGNTIGPNDVSPFSISQYDYDWVISNPCVFLWADKIILTPFINCRVPQLMSVLLTEFMSAFDIFSVFVEIDFVHVD